MEDWTSIFHTFIISAKVRFKKGKVISNGYQHDDNHCFVCLHCFCCAYLNYDDKKAMMTIILLFALGLVVSLVVGFLLAMWLVVRRVNYGQDIAWAARKTQDSAIEIAYLDGCLSALGWVAGKEEGLFKQLIQEASKCSGQ